MARGNLYGKLNVDSMSNQIKNLWYTKDKDLAELPRCGWSWQQVTDMSSIEDVDYLNKLLAISRLTRQEDYALMLWINGASMSDIAESMSVSNNRVGQVIGKALRKIRHYVKFLGRFDY